VQGQHAEAVADFARALELNPRTIMAGWHQNLGDGIRRRTTQLLADYIEGLWPRATEARPDRRREAAVSVRTPAFSPDGETTAEYPAVAPPKRIRRNRPAAPVSAETETATVPPTDKDSADAAPDDALAVELLLQDDEEKDTTTESAGADVTEADAASEPAVQPPMLVQCPNCKVIAVPAERLPDRRVRCAGCRCAFLPAHISSSIAALKAAQAPKPAKLGMARPNPAKPAKAKQAEADDDDRPRFTLHQKGIVGAAAAVVGFVLLYYFFPTFDASGANAPVTLAKTSADELLKEYTKNRVDAAKKFGTGPIVVSGEVTDVFRDKRPRIRFKAGDASRFFVEASFSHANDMKDIQKHQTISVRGECDGWQKNVVEVTLCKVVAHEPPAK
jgi:hypothetical protein